jgi:hypothetical protein
LPAPAAAKSISTPTTKIRTESPSNLVAISHPDLPPGVELMVPREQLGELVPVSRPATGAPLAPAPDQSPELTPPLLLTDSHAPSVPASPANVSPPLDLPEPTPLPKPEVADLTSASLPPERAPQVEPAAVLEQPTLISAPQTADPSQIDLEVEDLLNGSAARDLIEHPGGTALVLHNAKPTAPAVTAPTTTAPIATNTVPTSNAPVTAASAAPIANAPAHTPKNIDTALRARNEAKVAYKHSLASGVMENAGLNSEHLLPASVIARDPVAIEMNFKKSNSPTIMIDEQLHAAGLTYGQGINAVIYNFPNPLAMVDAAIANYTTLLNQPRFAHLDKANYLEGFAALRQTYLNEYPDVFDPNRVDWWKY